MDVAVRHRILAFAVKESWFKRTRSRWRAGPETTRRAEQSHLPRMICRCCGNMQAGGLLSFGVMRWTGFGVSDAVPLSFREVHFGSKEVERLTRKRKKKVFNRSAPNFSLRPGSGVRQSQGSARRPCPGEPSHRLGTHASTALSADDCAGPAGWCSKRTSSIPRHFCSRPG